MSGAGDLLGPEWATAPDGTRTRAASRVVVLDGAGRVLLLRGGDPARPGSDWWFTVGGGREPGEDARAAAVRELAEETGIVAAPAQLVGPVWRRVAEFSFCGHDCRQVEEFFVHRVPGGPDGPEGPALDRDGWTDLERASVVELRWWDPAALAADATAHFPPRLPDLLAALPATTPDAPLEIA